jgi:putative transcriptional regulator
MESLRGQVLIAAPSLLDPNFRRTVVFIAEHTEEGAMGLVLNRPAPTTVGEAVSDLDWLLDPDSQVFLGGPVRPEEAIVVAEFEEPAEDAALVHEAIGFVSAEPDDREATAAAVRRARLFAGFAGWGPGQLESELDAPGWITAPVQADDVFTEDADSLWSTVLRRKGREYALLATMPPDPSLN